MFYMKIFAYFFRLIALEKANKNILFILLVGIHKKNYENIS